MTNHVQILELVLVCVMAVWTVGSVAYVLPYPALRRWLDRHNGSLWFAKWTMFGAPRAPLSEVVNCTLEYRDVRKNPANWVALAHGRPWVWHACLWQPERKLADRLHRIGRDFAQASSKPKARATLSRLYFPLLARYVTTRQPSSVDSRLQIRILLRYSVWRPSPDSSWGVLSEQDFVVAEFDDRGLELP